jgi:hypothetical protein
MGRRSRTISDTVQLSDESTFVTNNPEKENPPKGETRRNV